MYTILAMAFRPGMIQPSKILSSYLKLSFHHPLHSAHQPLSDPQAYHILPLLAAYCHPFPTSNKWLFGSGKLLCFPHPSSWRLASVMLSRDSPPITPQNSEHHGDSIPHTRKALAHSRQVTTRMELAQFRPLILGADAPLYPTLLLGLLEHRHKSSL